MIHVEDAEQEAQRREDEDAHKALAAMGLHAEGPLSHRAAEPPGIFYLWPEHVESYRIFCACVTQWRIGADGGREGLDYPGVEIVMRQASGRRSGFRPRKHAQLWSEIHQLEAGALKAWGEERSKQQGTK